MTAYRIISAWAIWLHFRTRDGQVKDTGIEFELELENDLLL